MGLFDDAASFLQDISGSAGDAVQNVTDQASQLAENSGIADAAQNVTDQVSEVTQPLQDAQENAGNWFDNLTGGGN